MLTFSDDYLHTEHEAVYTLKEEPSQINVILQQKLPTAKLSTVCAVYKLASSGCNHGLRTAVKTRDTIPYFSYCSYCF